LEDSTAFSTSMMLLKDEMSRSSRSLASFVWTVSTVVEVSLLLAPARRVRVGETRDSTTSFVVMVMGERPLRLASSSRRGCSGPALRLDRSAPLLASV